MPVNPAYTASWDSHTRRSPRSSEPGTDMFVPIGTPVYAPAAGVVYGYGSSIGPATGRWVGIDFDNGLRFRALHLSRVMRIGGRVKAGELIGYSGASGYGYEDWSKLRTMPAAHVHVTLWPSHVTRFGYKSDGRTPWSVDFMRYVAKPAPAGPKPIKKEEDAMFPTILINKDNPSGTFYLYDIRAQKVIRPITRDENTSLRKAEKNGGASYIEVGAAEFKKAGGK
nr:M23 family metallopeptidase [uncultured Microbacterium sp.]